MMQRLIGKAFLILVSIAITPIIHAGMTATVDRTIISDQDLVTLTIRASDDASNIELDFSPIEQDFEIVSTSSRQNSSMSIINGRTISEVYRDHVLTLSPKRLGNLFIPSIRAGNERTQPITIQVRRLSAEQQQRMNQFVFFETSVDTNETYVQGQIIYSVKLFYTDAIGGDFPQPPALDDAIVETLENEKRYESMVNGRRYYVLEKRYAIFPQRSGTLTIPRERFIGTRGRGGIFSQRQRVSAVSESHQVTVKTIPAEFSGADWIPAKALGVSESWNQQRPVFRVGEPVNRKLTLTVLGLPDTILPQLGAIDVPNAKIYADPPETRQGVTPDGISAVQETTIGIVPTTEGEITLPEIRIPWWNTQSDQEEVAIIPAVTYTVLPAIGEAVTAPTITVPVTELTQPTQAVTETPNPIWQWAAIAVGILWLFSTWQWLSTRRRLAILESESSTRFEPLIFDAPSEEQEYTALRQACNRNDASKSLQHLRAWGRARFPGTETTADLADLSPALEKEIRRLETLLYSRDAADSWQGKQLLELVNDLRKPGIEKPVETALQTRLNPF